MCIRDSINAEYMGPLTEQFFKDAWSLFYGSHGHQEVVHELKEMINDFEQETGDKPNETNKNKAFNRILDEIHDGVNTMTMFAIKKNLIHVKRLQIISRPLSETFLPDENEFYDFEKFYHCEMLTYMQAFFCIATQEFESSYSIIKSNVMFLSLIHI
eukprot:TRINITY_DN9610_c0_g1_i2.p1 TRINITY_DN9610_c0_g1~~TRINITY_DN9610_c0_g1_i2.p1  ORF type:complete len:157 (+),score=23.22 TRINITY_DN9610_c0_g1_i2:65-535(+)